MSDTLIEFKNIQKSFDGKTNVIEEFSLEIKKGEFVTFLGPSGCGKTTILRMIGGFELPTSGTILLNGKDISMRPLHMRPVNTVFQKYALFPHLNVFDNVAFGLKLKKLPKKVQDEKVRRGAIDKVIESCSANGFSYIGHIDSPIKGGDGNTEFLAVFKYLL